MDSHFFLEKLKKDFPDEKFIGFFYDPNIHPYSEYRLRLLDVRRSCQKLGIELIEGEYDYQNWLNAVKGLENEKEKGKRCEVCFDKRFQVSANKALELGEKSFTTTLLVSPLKSQLQLKKSGEEFHKKTGIKFIAVDYRSKGGTQEQAEVTKKQQLYRQDYCGCMFGLKIQREEQNKFLDELFSPISNAILPASIEERLQIYKKRIQLEDKNIPYKIIKHKFLNYRELSLQVIQNKSKVIPAYALSYSTLPRKQANGKIQYEINQIHHFNRDEIKFISLSFYNDKLKKAYNTIKELIYNPPCFKEENLLRNLITDELYDLTPIIVLDEIPKDKKLIVKLHSKVYEDTKEKLIIQI